MMCLRSMMKVGVLFMLSAGSVFAGEVPKELQPRLFSFDKTKATVAEALEQLAVQTGNRVVDRRKNKTDAPLQLSVRDVPFWQALDAIAKASGAGVSLYEADGSIALVDRPASKVASVYSGVFRLAMRKVVATRDEEAGTHTCSLHVEIAWEPRVQPFYLELGSAAGPVTAIYAPDAQGNKSRKVVLPGRTPIPVPGRAAVEDILHLPAPDRSSPKIDSLKGSLRVVSPTKMLTFVFDPKTTTLDQDGVKVTLKRPTRDPWSVDVYIENPPGGPKFESYQSWLDNNTIHLEKGEGADKVIFRPNATDEMELEPLTATRAAIRYRFRDKGGPPPGRPEDWRIVYRTPGRIVEFAVPFEFKDVRLP
jgi:hypothetical protein